MKGRVFTNNNFTTSGQYAEKQNEVQENSDIKMNFNQEKFLNENIQQNEFSREEMKKNVIPNKTFNQDSNSNFNQNMYYNYNFPPNNFNQNYNFPNNNYAYPSQQYYNNFNQTFQYNQNQHFSQPKNYNYYPKTQQTQVDENSLIESLKYVSEKYPHLIKLNQSYLGITEKVKNQLNPRFFVIKSFTEEDIHKSIKYNVWSSTREGNKKLSNAYLDNIKKSSDIFLFFSMNGSGRFVGIAKVASEVNESEIFEFWAMDDVWKGLFRVEWIVIKDIPNKFFKDIKLSNNAFKPVTNSRDTQEIPRMEGERMVSIFEDFKNQTNLLQHFQYYDERQDLFEQTKQK